MAERFLKIAVLYLVAGVSLGWVMGITEKFDLAPVHAHLGVLGWLSLAVAGLMYRLYPTAAATALARAHFWLHNLGLPIFMGALTMKLSGQAAAGPVIGLGATMVWLGLVLFAVNVIRSVRAA